MGTRSRSWSPAVGITWGLALMCACGTRSPAPRPDDPDDADLRATVAALAEPGRRAEAVDRLQQLYRASLRSASGDRAHQDPRRIVEASIDALVAAYLESGSERSLELLLEMRDPRVWPAVRRALQLDGPGRGSVDQASIAAAAFSQIEMEGTEREHVQALSGALMRSLRSNEPERLVDSHTQLQRRCIQALSQIRHPEATDVLIELLAHVDPRALVPRVPIEASRGLARQADPRAIPALVLALYRPSGDLILRAEAAYALSAIGPPSLPPLLALLRGENQEALALAEQMPETGSRSSEHGPASTVAMGASFALGELGLAEAVEPLLVEAARPELERRTEAALALMRLHALGDERRIREAIVAVYRRATELERSSLMDSMRAMYDTGLRQFFLQEVRRLARAESFSAFAIDAALAAGRAYVEISDAEAATAMLAVLDRLPPAGLSGIDANRVSRFVDSARTQLEAAQTCDRDVACWARRSRSQRQPEVEQAIGMLASIGGDAALVALAALLNGENIQVTTTTLEAIDRIGNASSAEALSAIDALAAPEESPFAGRAGAGVRVRLLRRSAADPLRGQQDPH